MDIQSRHFGPIANQRLNGTVGDVDVEALVNRLILFDVCFIESHGLKEVPALVDAFGAAGLLKLIYAGAIVFICDIVTPGQTGQTSGLQSPEQGSGVLPTGSYRVVNVELAKGEPHRSQYLEKALTEVEAAQVPKTDRSRIKLALRSRIAVYPVTASIAALADSYRDIALGGPLVERAIRRSVAMQTGVDPGPGVGYSAEQLGRDGEFRIETALDLKSKFSAEVEHKVVERAILAVAGLNQRVHLMQGFSALTGFKDSDAELLESKLSILADTYNADSIEERMARVVTLGNLSNPTHASVVDVDRLMKYRATEECSQFRIWLRSSDERSDREIAAEFNAVRSKIAIAIGSPIGKAIRFLVSTAAGVVPVAGAIAGPTVSAADAFLLDRIVGRPGPVAFLGKKYPPIFRG
jgi:hypothetical protein